MNGDSELVHLYLKHHFPCLLLHAFGCFMLLRYIQVGNAVAVPVARALGYSLAMAMKGSSEGKPLMSLPDNFPSHAEQIEVSQ